MRGYWGTLKMSKRQERESVFLLLFEKCFNEDDLEVIIENAELARDFKSNPNILIKTKATLISSQNTSCFFVFLFLCSFKTKVGLLLFFSLFFLL